MRLALIDITNTVVNVVAWDGVTVLDTPNFTQVDVTSLPQVAAGWTFDGTNFNAPAVPVLRGPRGQVIQPDINVEKTKRKKAASDNVAALITAGVVSSVTGTPYTYPTQTTDQINLLGQVEASTLDPSSTFTFWCMGADGVWLHLSHTGEQIRALGLEVRLHITTLQAQYADMVVAIDAATTVAEVLAVSVTF